VFVLQAISREINSLPNLYKHLHATRVQHVNSRFVQKLCPEARRLGTESRL
jgi:hypothetical protein